LYAALVASWTYIARKPEGPLDSVASTPRLGKWRANSDRSERLRA